MPDAIWDGVWADNLVTSDYSLKYLDFIGELEQTLPEGSRVLEAGCGTGQTLSCFLRRHETHALDISRRALGLARGRCSYPVLGDIFSMPFRDNTFDLVYNSGVIEHFREPENRQAIREMARVTRRHGTVVIIVPNSLCPWYRAGKWMAVMMKRFEFGSEEAYTPWRLRRAVEEAGLSVRVVFGLQALPPLATKNREVAPLAWRRRIGRIERIFPGKEYYAYTVGVIARKE
jgi:SAM-dependent methyltransferase